MAASRTGKGKKVVNQEELRRLMREKQRETADRKKRIESPFAKYNSLGHLSCVLCNTPIKSETLWQTHILGKQHKEKVAELKGAKLADSSASVLKRKAPDTEKLEVKKVRAASDGKESSQSAGLPADFFDSKGGKKTTSPIQKSGLGLLAGNYDEEDDEADQEDSSQNAGNSVVMKRDLPPPAATGLPADFFDCSIPPAPIVSHSGSIQKADEPEKPIERKDNTAEALPEGFFDDPVRDAKVRKVDAPKDQMDKEWEEFQKEMRQVNNASEAIVAEDDEEGRIDRQIGEIDEQIECYRRIEVLRDRQDIIKEKVRKRLEAMPKHSTEEMNTDEEEEELLDLLSSDWRAKGAIL
ncbi:ZN830 protein, partial [Atractosteus spatula]|nr:ZN830 protein [Atractosteus spatula]